MGVFGYGYWKEKYLCWRVGKTIERNSALTIFIWALKSIYQPFISSENFRNHLGFSNGVKKISHFVWGFAF